MFWEYVWGCKNKLFFSCCPSINFTITFPGNWRMASNYASKFIYHQNLYSNNNTSWSNVRKNTGICRCIFGNSVTDDWSKTWSEGKEDAATLQEHDLLVKLLYQKHTDWICCQNCLRDYVFEAVSIRSNNYPWTKTSMIFLHISDQAYGWNSN